MKQRQFFMLTVMLMATLLLIPAAPVSADVAPPYPPSGSNPGTQQQATRVEMLAETVIIEPYSVKPKVPEPKLDGDYTEAEVRADFTLRNRGSREESMQVIFPLQDPSGRGLWVDPEAYPKLDQKVRDFKVKVNRTAVKTREVALPLLQGEGFVTWAAFDVTFPAGEDVQIEVSYTLQAIGWVYDTYTSFEYILETGAGWQGAIGSADIILRLPYEANRFNVIDDPQYWHTTTPGGVYAGNEVRWHYENLEPTRENNMIFEIVPPYLWLPVLQARETVDKAPKNGDAWGALARAYKKLLLFDKHTIRLDAGGQEIARLAVEAYEQAIALAPKTARWHAGYAELLYYLADSEQMMSAAPFPPSELVNTTVRELHTALRLEPGNEQAQEILSYACSAWAGEALNCPEGGEVQYLALTATLAARPTLTPTIEIILQGTEGAPSPAQGGVTGSVSETVEKTPEPSRTPRPTRTFLAPTSDPARPLPDKGVRFFPCAAPLALPLGGVLLLALRRKKPD